jgi:cytoskeletal protein CcmA (bactofilin family)
MWKRKEDELPRALSPAPATPVVVPKEVRSMEAPKTDAFRADVAHIGKSVVVKGELSGSEDLYLDGEVEGSIELTGHSLIIGPNGRVRANVNARDVVVHGKVDGNLRGSERVELKKSAILVGDIATQRIVVEDGAYFKGAVDIQKDVPARPEAKDAKASAAAAAAAPSPTPLLDQKKI